MKRAILGFVAAGSLTLISACTNLPPAPLTIEGEVGAVSQADINAAIAALEDRLVEQKHSLQPIDRVLVNGHNEMNIYYGAHYGNSRPPGLCHVVRIRGKWTVREMGFIDPNIIVTG